MIGITKKRLYKIKKIKNQSRKIPKRKHKRKRKKKQNKSFRRRRKYNLKNKSLKKYKGGGFFTFDEIMKLKPNAQNAEIEQIHKEKLSRLKEAAKRGEKVIIKQIVPVKGSRPDEYGIMDMFFGKDLKLKDDFYSTKTPENLEQKNLKNKLLGLQLTITRKNMAPFKKPLYEIINSILLKMALDKKNDGPLYKFFKMPFYKKDGPNNVDERKKKDPFHDIADENNGSIELMKLLTANEWFKVMFTDPKRNYSVETMTTASEVPGVIESGLTVLQNKEEVVNPPPPPGVAVGSPPTKEDDEDTSDIPTKDEEPSDIETETDEDETIIEDITSAAEIAELEALLSNDKKLIDNYNQKMSFNDLDNDDAYAFLNEGIQQSPSLLSTEEIKTAIDEIDNDSFDDLYQDIQGDGEEYVTDADDKKMQKNLGTMLMTDKETELLGKEVDKSIDDRIKILSNINDKLPQDSTEPLEEPVPGIQEAMEESRRKSRERMDSIESKSSFGEADEGLIRGPTPRPGTPLGKKIKGKIGSKLRDYADAANDPDTGMRARLGKLAPKKYVKLPPPDKPNIYFKATFRNDDWNLKLEKEGFAKDARSWLARVGIMSGGNIGEIESY